MSRAPERGGVGWGRGGSGGSRRSERARGNGESNENRKRDEMVKKEGFKRRIK